MYKIFATILIMASLLFAGSHTQLTNNQYHIVYGISPDCDSNSSDTIGPIALTEAKYFSFGFGGNRITGGDTAIIDSGFTVNTYMASAEDSSKMFRPVTADSVIDIFGSGSFDDRAVPKVKGLELPAMPFVYFVITRTDTDVNVLDFKNSAGVADNTIMTFSIIKENR